MRPVQVFAVPGPMMSDRDKINWCVEMVKALCLASQQNPSAIGDAFLVSNVPAAGVRTLDAATATATDVAEVLGTLIRDTQRRGAKGGPGIG